jgi:hypothetical protein
MCRISYVPIYYPKYFHLGVAFFHTTDTCSLPLKRFGSPSEIRSYRVIILFLLRAYHDYRP